MVVEQILEQVVQVLVVSDDEDDYRITRALLSRVEGMKYVSDWASNFDAGLQALLKSEHDICLLDNRLGERSGLELLRAAGSAGVKVPIILLTGEGDRELDLEASRAGAADYMLKGQFTSALLERSIRYAIERQRAAKALQDSETKFRSVTQSAHDAIIATDSQGRIISWNKGAHTIFGYREDEILGRPVSSLMPEIYRATQEQFIERHAETGEAHVIGQMVELAGLRKDGGEFPLELSLTTWDSGTERFYSGIIRDITERKRIAVELEQARDAALESAQLKSEFLANMSHEIRTPMNGVIGMADLLLDTDLADHQRDYAETIQTSADSLLRIIDDILDFSKIEAGLLRFEKIDFDLRHAVESTVELLAERAQEKGLELASLVHHDVPASLRGDPGRLRQVLTNLIGNAVKFTDRGEVVVSVTKISETTTDALLRFEIQDTGIGISTESLRRLFRPFTQADGSTTRKYGGTGLGLAISKQLAELMGGEIGVESAPEAGSTFWFTGTFEKQPEQAAAQIQTAGAVSLESVRVLIVDDNTTNRKILLHQTTSWGMIAAEAESGTQAIGLLQMAAAQGEPYDIAILDLMMPGMDGFQLAKAIKSDLAIAGVRLVLLPSYGRRGDGEAARQAGISAYLHKPVRQSQLYNCLIEIMSHPSSGEIATPSHLVTRHSLQEIKVTPRKKTALSTVSILVVEDSLVNQAVALNHLKNLGYQAKAVPNGLEALKTLETEQFDTILMDCQMPEMDGFEAATEIRQREGATRHTTIIAMTANALEGDREKCLAAGMDDYLSKPFRSDTFRQKLEQWVKPTNGAGAKLGQHAVDACALPGLQLNAERVPLNSDRVGGVNLSVLASYRDIQRPGTPDLVTELIDLFLKETAAQIMMLHESVSGNDADEIMRVAHQLKGGSGNIGAGPMASLAQALEEKGIERKDAEALLLQLELEFGRVREALEAERID